MPIPTNSIDATARLAASATATAAVTEWALDRSDVSVRPFPVDAVAATSLSSGADMRGWLLLAAGRERVNR